MTIQELLEKEGVNESNVLREHALFIALTKKSFFETECHGFELKYRMSFDEFQSNIASQKNTEDYKISDDVMQWEYAVKALAWWSERIEEACLVA